MSSVRALAAALAAACLLATGAASAQTYPDRPITLLVPFPPGGATDTIARIIQDPMQKMLGQTIVVENVGGAGGMICAARGARAAPDGYTFMIHQVALAAGMSLYPDLKFDAVKDFAPIGLINTAASALAAPASLPPKDFKELLAWIRRSRCSTPSSTAAAASGSCSRRSANDPAGQARGARCAARSRPPISPRTRARTATRTTCSTDCPAEGGARLAAWCAFVLQTHADNLVSSGSATGFCERGGLRRGADPLRARARLARAGARGDARAATARLDVIVPAPYPRPHGAAGPRRARGDAEDARDGAGPGGRRARGAEGRADLRAAQPDARRAPSLRSTRPSDSQPAIRRARAPGHSGADAPRRARPRPTRRASCWRGPSCSRGPRAPSRPGPVRRARRR